MSTVIAVLETDEAGDLLENALDDVCGVADKFGYSVEPIFPDESEARLKTMYVVTKTQVLESDTESDKYTMMSELSSLACVSAAYLKPDGSPPS